MLFLFFVQGFQEGGRFAVVFVYFIEIAPKKYADILCTIGNCSMGSVYLWLTLYFRYIDKDWIWTIAFGACLQAISLFIHLTFVPESP